MTTRFLDLRPRQAGYVGWALTAVGWQAIVQNDDARSCELSLDQLAPPDAAVKRVCRRGRHPAGGTTTPARPGRAGRPSAACLALARGAGVRPEMWLRPASLAVGAGRSAGGDQPDPELAEVIDLLAQPSPDGVHLPPDTTPENFCQRLRLALHAITGPQRVADAKAAEAGSGLKQEPQPLYMSLEGLSPAARALARGAGLTGGR
jgi:hypothetical protein